MAVCALTFDARLADIENVFAALRAILVPLGLNPDLLVTRGGYLMRVPSNYRSQLAKRRTVTYTVLQVRDDPRVELRLSWYPPGYKWAHYRRTYLADFCFLFWDQCDLDFGEQLLRSLAAEAHAFWGEVLEHALAGRLTHLTYESHRTCIPHLGMVNFFGADYCTLLGRDRIRSAGFAVAQAWAGGMIVKLPPADSFESHVWIRTGIENVLAPPGAFDPRRGAFKAEFGAWAERLRR